MYIYLVSSLGYRVSINLIMDVPVNPVMAYKYKAELLVKDFLLADPYVPYAAVLAGILMCKLVLSFTLSSSSVKSSYDHSTSLPVQ
jgi:hypothetical protein